MASAALKPGRKHEKPTRQFADNLKPPLKWAGGKRWLIDQLQPIWSALNQSRSSEYRLVEPFCGGLAIALGLRPQTSLLNDANPHNINFYRCLQRGLVIEMPLQNDADRYYANREAFNTLIDNKAEHTVEAAELFYYLNHTGYNGLCRVNRRGRFNVPFGRYKTINYRRDFLPYRELLAKWLFETGDFEALELTDDDFVYADPPYDVPFRQYAQGGFEWDDQQRLVRWLAALKGPVVASNQATDRILELYREHDFEITLIDAPRMISCNGDRSKAREMLATKNI